VSSLHLCACHISPASVPDGNGFERNSASTTHYLLHKTYSPNCLEIHLDDVVNTLLFKVSLIQPDGTIDLLAKEIIVSGEVMSQLIHRTSVSKKPKGLFIYDEASKSGVGPGEFNLRSQGQAYPMALPQKLPPTPVYPEPLPPPLFCQPPAGYHSLRVSLSPTSKYEQRKDTVDEDILMQEILQPAHAPLCDDTGLGVNEGEDVNVDDESAHNDLGDESVCNVQKKR